MNLPAGSAPTRRTRVVIVNFEYPPIAGPGIWRMLALSRDLDALGCEVSVVCSDRSSWHSLTDPTLLERIPPAVRVMRIHAPLLADWNDALQARAQVARHRFARTAWNRARLLLARYIPDPAIAWAIRAARVIGDELRDAPGPVFIISSGPAHLTHLAALITRGRSRATWIMDYRDLWTSEPRLVYQGPYQPRLLRWLEQRCLRACDAIVSVSPAWLADIGEVAGHDPAVTAKLRVIRNGHDLDTGLLATLHADRLRGERLHLHFSGTLQIGTRESAIALLEGLALLRTRRPDLAPPRVTFTGLHRRVVAAVQRLQLDDMVEDVGYRSQGEALQLSAQADVLLVLVDSAGRGRRGVIPAKTYECMALGRHVLAIVPPGSDVRPLLTDYGEATICTEDAAEVSTALERLVTMQAGESGVPAALPERSRAALECNSRLAAAREFMQLIGQLTARDAPVPRDPQPG